jgi:hypothetical protein
MIAIETEYGNMVTTSPQELKSDLEDKVELKSLSIRTSTGEEK